MANSDEIINRKLSGFERSIMKVVAEKTEALQKELEEIKSREIEDYSSEIERDNRDMVTVNISNLKIDNEKLIAAKKAEYRKALYKKRDDYMNEVFLKTAKSLSDFASRAEYKSFLFSKIEFFRNKCCLSSSEIYISERDTKYKDEIIKIYTANCAVICDSTIKIGGAVLKNDEIGLIIDESLDSALEEQRAVFLEQSDFFINF